MSAATVFEPSARGYTVVRRSVVRNAVIVAVADCVVFLVAVVSGSIHAALVVVVLSAAGLLLVFADWRAHRADDAGGLPGEGGPGDAARLVPDDFTPDIAESEHSGVTPPAAEPDELGEDSTPHRDRAPSDQAPW